MLEFTGRPRPSALGLPIRAGHRSAARVPTPVLRDVPRTAEGPKALGALLRDRGLLTEAQLESAIARQHQTGRRLGHVLVDLGFVTAEAVLEALSLQMGVPTVRINAYTVNTDALKALPEKVARRHTAFPLQKIGTTLIVALASPKDLAALDDLRFACGCEIQTSLALEHEIVSAIDRYYRDEWVPAAPADDGGGSVKIESVATQWLARDEAAERSAVSMLERVIGRAAKEGASDIHFEPRQDDFRIRFRIDGTFRDVALLPIELSPALVARVKVVLRRVSGDSTVEVIRAGNVALDRAHYTVLVGRREVTLTPTEFEIMATLMSQPSRIFSRTQLLNAAHGVAFESYERAIDSHIRNLRHKLEPDELIFTVHGVGYKFEA